MRGFYYTAYDRGTGLALHHSGDYGFLFWFTHVDCPWWSVRVSEWWVLKTTRALDCVEFAE